MQGVNAMAMSGAGGSLYNAFGAAANSARHTSVGDYSTIHANPHMHMANMHKHPVGSSCLFD